jgi:hypothetical protein
MEDLADEECVVQIFIRCPGHLWGDDKFGQIGGGRKLAGDERRWPGGTLWGTAGNKVGMDTARAEVELGTSQP